MLTPAYRWQVASRCLAAAVGGFALASAASIVLAWLLLRSGVAPRASATLTATLLSFALWCGVVMWCFHTASLKRAWLNMVMPALVFAAAAWWLRSP